MNGFPFRKDFRQTLPSKPLRKWWSKSKNTIKTTGNASADVVQRNQFIVNCKIPLTTELQGKVDRYIVYIGEYDGYIPLVCSFVRAESVAGG